MEKRVTAAGGGRSMGKSAVAVTVAAKLEKLCWWGKDDNNMSMMTFGYEKLRMNERLKCAKVRV